MTMSVSSDRTCVATQAASSRPGVSEARAPSSAVASERRSAGTTGSSASAKPRTNGNSVAASGGTSYTIDDGTVTRNWRSATDLPKPAGAMIIAMRYCAAVASRSSTRGRSIGRKIPPRSGRPSDATLRINSTAPYSPFGKRPWFFSAMLAEQMAILNGSRRRPTYEYRPLGGAGGAAVPLGCASPGLAALARDQAQAASRLEGWVGVDAPEGLFADLSGQLAALAHGGLQLAEGPREVVAVDRADLLF